MVGEFIVLIGNESNRLVQNSIFFNKSSSMAFNFMSWYEFDIDNIGPFFICTYDSQMNFFNGPSSSGFGVGFETKITLVFLSKYVFTIHIHK